MSQDSMKKQTVLTNEELIELIRSGDDPQGNTERLYKQNVKLIESVVRRYKSLDDHDDLFQEGSIALIVAVNTWDENAGISFSAFAWMQIRAAVQRYIDNHSTLIRIPVARHQQIRDYKNYELKFSQVMIRAPTAAEAAAALETSPGVIEAIRAAIRITNSISLDTPLSDTEESLTLADVIEDPEALAVIDDAEQQIDNAELSRILWGAVDDLQEYGATEIIRGRYQDQTTFKDLAALLDIPEWKAQRIEKRSLARLRNQRTLWKWIPPDWAYSQGLKGTGFTAWKETGSSSTERAVIKALDDIV